MTSVRQLYQHVFQELQHLYPETEAQQLTYWLLEHFLVIKRSDIIRDKPVPKVSEGFHHALGLLLKGHPIQYILGKAPFYGRAFKVSPEVLIPRNETEELVHLIIQENPQPGLHILDIGTGTGCIPISLFLEMPQAKVEALDISPGALAIARENAQTLDAPVAFHQVDILKEEIPVKNLDILVSNPPYVRELEKAMMHRNVLDHEPGLALFVSNEDPLVFYRSIAQKAQKSLKPGGKLYFEINEALGKEMVDLLQDLGYQQVQLHQDLKGKDRMVVGSFSGLERV